MSFGDKQTGTAGNKTKSLGLDRPHPEETRRIHSQEGHRVEPLTGGTQEWKSWRRNSWCVKIGSPMFHEERGQLNECVVPENFHIHPEDPLHLKV